MAGVSLPDAIKMMTATPARILGVLDKKGELAGGKDADIVIFDDNITVSMTMIKGRIVYDGGPKK
jgi:N-acetylglucosamine-6-phosphate deacetylase